MVPLLDGAVAAALRRFLGAGAGVDSLSQEGTPLALQQQLEEAQSINTVSTAAHTPAELKGPFKESSGREKGQDAIEADTLLMKAGFTSILAARLAADLQMQIGKPVPPILLFEHPTPRSVYNYLNAASSSPVYSSIDQLCRFLVSFRNRARATLEDGGADSEDNMPSKELLSEHAGHLDSDIRVPPELAHSIATEPKGVLLTGCTGFLGIFLLAELLNKTSATVYVLVRAEDYVDGMRRVEQNAAQYGLSLALGRCVIVLGSLAKASLGVQPSIYKMLSHQVDAVWHCGARNDHVMSYAKLHASNVYGTVEVLRFAVKGKLKPVHFISSVIVGSGASPGPAEVFTEASPLPSAAQMLDPRLASVGGLSGYAQSKWVADSLCLLAAGRGLPVTIHRPARILASTRTGACNPNDLHVRLAVGAVQLGSLPSGLNGVEYGAAVDHVAAAIVVLGLNAQRKGEYGSVFHVWERRPISAKALCSVLAVDYGLSVIQHDAWLEELTQAASSNALGPLIHEVSCSVPVDFVPSFNSFTTTIACARLGCKMGPSLDYQHVRRQLKFLQSLGMLPSPPISYGELRRLRRLTGELQRIPTEMYLKMQFGLGPSRLRQTIQRARSSLQLATSRLHEQVYRPRNRLRVRRVEQNVVSPPSLEATSSHTEDRSVETGSRTNLLGQNTAEHLDSGAP